MDTHGLLNGKGPALGCASFPNQPVYLSIHLPTWATDRVQRQNRQISRTRSTSEAPEPRPLLLAASHRGQRIVAACCGPARAGGVRVGMTIAHATALLPAVPDIRDHEPDLDTAALHSLARWAIRFTPIAAADPPDGLVLDATGCARLYDGIDRLIEQVLQRLRALQIDTRIAAAPTIGAAWGLARFATDERRPWILVEQDYLLPVVADLPVTALRLDPTVVAALADVGLDRVGDLQQIPRDQVVQRFSPDVLQRLDQATGETMELLDPEQPVEPPRVAFRFAGPTLQSEAIEQVVRQLTNELAQALLKGEAGVRRLVLEVERLDENLHPERARESLTLSRPSRDAKHLWSLLRPRVERLQLGNGIERLDLVAVSVGRLPHQQIRTDGQPETDPADASAATGQLVDLLQSRLKPPNVLRCVPVDSHVPEAAFRFYPASQRRPAHVATGEIAGDRPTVLLERPEPAQVTLMNPEGPILTVQWHTLHRIITTSGPERIGRRWWRFGLSQKSLGVRDYYRVQDESGRWLWVFRQRPTGRWFVHGLWA